jgi:uncharacterized membrane protein YfcA
VGLALAILGGGGAILTVPILVFLFAVPATQATGYSLGIVGATGLVGAIQAQTQKSVRWPIVALYLPLSILSTLFVRSWVMPQLPKVLFEIGEHPVGRDSALMIVFACLLLMSARAMLKPKKVESAEEPSLARIPFIGLGVGLISGLLGAGGGFLIVPALVLFASLEMPVAIGTSLTIICLNSLFGFSAVIAKGQLPWPLLLGVTAAAMIGMLAGFQIRSKIDPKRLRPAFGWFLVANAAFMLVNGVVQIIQVQG